jgi:hypothetical protein
MLCDNGIAAKLAPAQARENAKIAHQMEIVMVDENEFEGAARDFSGNI